MVLERLVKISSLERKPWELFLIGAVWTVFAAGIALFLFPEYSSLVSVTFTVMLTLPFVYSSVFHEEEAYHKTKGELSLLKVHGHIFRGYLALFLGIMMGFFLWYVFAPEEIVSYLFQAQAATISNVNMATGNSVAIDTFWIIFWHNSKILIVSLLLAFFLGAGPIFILTWNASVIATAIGNQFRNELALLNSTGWSLLWTETAKSLSFPFYRYLIHGVPEILAYIIGGLAGGLISTAVIKHKAGTKHYARTFGDAAAMIALAFAFLLIAAALEVQILSSVL